MSWSGRERRRHRRVKSNLAAELRVAERTWIGKLRDLSRGGAYFEAEGVYRDLPQPEVRGVLFAPRLGARVCPIEVRNRRTLHGAVSGLGLRFASLDRDLEARLETHLKERAE